MAHETSTLSGVAASPHARPAIARLVRFKGRKGPFLLLAANPKKAVGCFRWLPCALRLRARHCWPGRTTLVGPARAGLRHLARRGMIAVRVDASPEARLLARLAGGLVLSTSLNRKGQAPKHPSRRLRLRWHRWLDLALPGQPGAGAPSTIERWTPRGWQRLR